MKKHQRIYEISAVLGISILFRVVIFYGAFAPHVDAAEFATFVREIAINNGSVPTVNSLYFPGSRFIYPPLLFLFVYYVSLIFHAGGPSQGYFYLYSLFVLAVVAGSVKNAFIYRKTVNPEVKGSRALSFVIPVFFGVDIYALTWGGYAYIVDYLFLILLLFHLDKGKWNRYDFLYGAFLSLVIPLTHDLTWFIAEASVTGFLIFNVIQKRRVKAIMSSFILIVSTVTGIIWWLPRVSFVVSAISIGQSAGAGFFSPVNSDYSALLAIPFGVPVGVLAVLELVASLRRHKFEPIDAFTVAMVVGAFMLLIIVRDPIIAARIALYLYTFLMIIVLKNIHIISWKGVMGSRHMRWNLKPRKVVALAVVLLFAVGIPSQFAISSSASHYYSEGMFLYDHDLITWAGSHMQNGTILAPEIGNYISSIDGLPVILYSGFIVGKEQIIQREVALDLISGHINSSLMKLLDTYNIRYLILPLSLMEKNGSEHVNIKTPPLYLMKNFGDYSVYRISYMQLNQNYQ